MCSQPWPHNATSPVPLVPDGCVVLVFRVVNVCGAGGCRQLCDEVVKGAVCKVLGGQGQHDSKCGPALAHTNTAGAGDQGNGFSPRPNKAWLGQQCSVWMVAALLASVSLHSLFF